MAAATHSDPKPDKAKADDDGVKQEEVEPRGVVTKGDGPIDPDTGDRTDTWRPG